MWHEALKGAIFLVKIFFGLILFAVVMVSAGGLAAVLILWIFGTGTPQNIAALFVGALVGFAAAGAVAGVLDHFQFGYDK